MTEHFNQTLYRSFKLLKEVVPKIINANKTSGNVSILNESAYNSNTSAISSVKLNRSDS
eukprot:CAMPEP_0176398790 /NCGR_PEP_ID=MMETSP0126-20121128/46199_1 /TAXON_ID=141414 ORGANISM="Strombidinopsis acuminatum, Strain SPMC142" /NCGR_SAMPLE_ID=MMETSP0126 /ASSEMBLY_ACC=CAM_ASM_000229 /LENGTH=58 /DNA_ID=CAMNT_0017773897 /DNA_START=369 /DNA_END=545 /DNA_ORIENTATION=-